MADFIATLQTDKDTDFIGALATNAVGYADLALPGALSGMGGRARCRLSMITIVATENLSYEVMLFSKAAHATADPDTDSFLGRWSWQAADAVRIAGAGLYYYSIFGLDVPYTDDDSTGKLHVGLLNRSVASKTAGAGGALSIRLTFTELGA